MVQRLAGAAACAAALVWGAPVSGAQPASDDTAEAPAAATRAQQLFDDGVLNMLAGNYTRGCAQLTESQEIDPKAGTVFTLAECYGRAGRIASALERYSEYLKIFASLAPEQRTAHRERARIARQEREKLRKRVPRLTIVWSGRAPAGARVLLNGKAVPDEEIGKPQVVDPGEHFIEVRHAAGQATETRLSVEQAQTARVVLPSPAQGAASTSSTTHTEITSSGQPPAGRTRGSTQRTVAYMSGGVGVAGLVVGTVAGLMVIGHKGTIDDHCADIGGGRAQCDSEGLDAADAVGTLSPIATAGFIVGAAGIGTAVTLLLTAPSTSEPARTARGWRMRVSGGPSAAQLQLGTSF